MPPNDGISASDAATAAPSPVSARPGRQAVLARLRRHLQRLERGTAPAAGQRVRFEVPVVDRALPGGGLDPAALHEVVAAEADGAAVAFTAALAARRAGDHGVVLWCTERPGLYPPGLMAFGLRPERLLLARGRDDQARLWAMEEGLRCPALAAVVGEVRRIDLTQSRRLQLAAAGTGVMALLLRPAGAALSAGAAATRWRIAGAPGTPPASYAGVGRPCLTAELLRVRGGEPRSWCLEWTGRGFTLAGQMEVEADVSDSKGRDGGGGRTAGAGAVAALVADRPAAPRPRARHG